MAVMIFVSLARHQFTLLDHEHGASASCGVHLLVIIALAHGGMARLS